MPSTVTVTGTVGPGFTATALVITLVSEFRIDCDKEMLYVTANGVIKEFYIGVATTITCTVTGNTYTLTIS
jgi:hypothetical protein